MDVKGHAWVIVQSSKATSRDALAIIIKGLDHLTKATLKGSLRDYDIYIKGLWKSVPTFKGHDCFVI